MDSHTFGQSMSSPFISISQADIGYMNKPVLTNVSLDIIKGEQWAIVGESGSGKTLLLNAIAGNVHITKGTLNRYFINYDSLRGHIAFVASRHSFRNLSNTTDLYYQQRYNSTDSDDALTVSQYLQNIEAVTKLSHHWDLDKVIALLKLAPLADKQLIKLSNGETKRLLIAAALIKNPDLLLLDNPLAGLDIKTRAAFTNIIGGIAASGTTIIMATSTHEIPAAITHIGLIKGGAVIPMRVKEFDPDDSGLSPVTNNFNLTGLLGRYPSPQYGHIVNMRNVNIRYGEKQILSNINWEIRQGERWALLGPNGAGKSTLLSLINGDNPQAYANDITLFDRKRGSGESIWDIKKKTGFISPELYQYFPADSSCLQAIESGYYDTMGLFRPSDKNKVDVALQWMKVLGIDQYARQLLKNIPAGAQRLCLLARAMIKCPVLLILDEPCQGMDDNQVQHFKALVDAICQQTNITLIYVTHYTMHIPDSVSQLLRLGPQAP